MRFVPAAAVTLLRVARQGLGWLEEVIGQKNGGLWGVSDEEDFYWIDDRIAYRYLRNEEVGIDERLRVAQSINWIFDGNRWRPMSDMELVHRGLEHVILAMGKVVPRLAGPRQPD